jgi:hypothetical protein
MQCPECGYEIDEVNESISVCPRCGTEHKLHEEPVSKLIN